MAFKAADNAEKLGCVTGINVNITGYLYETEYEIDTSPSNCILDHLSKRSKFMFI